MCRSVILITIIVDTIKGETSLWHALLCLIPDSKIKYCSKDANHLFRIFSVRNLAISCVLKQKESLRYVVPKTKRAVGEIPLRSGLNTSKSFVQEEKFGISETKQRKIPQSTKKVLVQSNQSRKIRRFKDRPPPHFDTPLPPPPPLPCIETN